MSDPLTNPNQYTIGNVNDNLPYGYTELEKNQVGIATVTDFKFLRDSYFGTGGYKDGNYIIPHVREELVRYNRRKRMAYYKNYIKILVNSITTPIWREEPTRQYNESASLFNVFLEDVDLKRNDLTQFMKKAGMFAKLMGKSFILMDNFSDPAIGLSEAVEMRNLPYLVLITADRIVDWEIDSFGNLIRITYAEPEGNTTKEKPKMLEKTWTVDNWVLYDPEKKKVVREGENTLGEIPIIEYWGTESDQFLPESDLYQVARIAFRVFNLDSEITEIESNQMYPMLVLPDNGIQNMSVGTSSGLKFDPEGQKPSYIAPPDTPIKVLKENESDLIADMFELTGFFKSAGINNLSAKSKEWDYERTEKILNDFSLNSQIVENMIGIMFELFTNETVNLVSQYSKKFGVANLFNEVERSVEALNLNLGPIGNAEIKKKYARQEFAYSSEETIKAVLESIDKQAELEEVRYKIDIENENNEEEI